MRRTHNAIQASNLSRFERRAGDIRPYSNFLLRKKLLLAGLGPLGAVLGTGLHPAVDALGIQRAADDVVTHTGQVLDTAAADHDHRVLLQVVADTGDIGSDLVSVGQLPPPSSMA